MAPRLSKDKTRWKNLSRSDKIVALSIQIHVQTKRENQMQFTIRVDANNHLTVSTILRKSDDPQYADRPELAAATISDKQLSDITENQLFDILGQVIDHFTHTDVPAPTGPNEDWRENFRAGQPL